MNVNRSQYRTGCKNYGTVKSDSVGTIDRPFGCPLDEPASIAFTVPGEAVPWARAGAHGTVRFTPAKQRSYAGVLKLFCGNAMAGRPPLEGPVALRVEASYGWPASWSARQRSRPGARWKTSRADLSNVIKLVEDALNTVAWRDDAQIVMCTAYKLYSDLPALRVEVTPCAS